MRRKITGNAEDEIQDNGNVGEEQVSDTQIYSVDTYGNKKAGSILNLCRALMAYSDSAKAYFG